MADSKEPAIRVSSVSKDFRLPHERTQSVKSAFTGLFRSKDRTVTVQHALRDVTFEVGQGEFFGILGRNGSGKSTLLKILANIYTPTEGSVAVRGKLVPFIELGVGFNPELTGRENVFLNGALLGFSQKELESRYQDIVTFAELEDFMDQKLKNYSSGMQVRLAFSMAVRADADVLLVDEVLAVGDADFQRKCFEYFRMLKKRKKTVVFVSHDMNAVREFCDRALLIDKSEVVAIGSADSIAQKYTRLFIDSETTAQTGPAPTVRPDDVERWGEGQILIDSAQLSKSSISEDDATFTITARIKAARDYNGAALGFNVKSASGEAIYGTNTHIKQQPIPKLAVGESCQITWTCPNILADGGYTVDLAVHDTDGLVVYDWWEDALALEVRRSEKTAYAIVPEIGLKIGD